MWLTLHVSFACLLCLDYVLLLPFFARKSRLDLPPRYWLFTSLLNQSQQCSFTPCTNMPQCMGPSICLRLGHTNTQRSFGLLATPLCLVVGAWGSLWRSRLFRLLATAHPGCRSLSGLAQQMTQLTSLLIPSDFQFSVWKDRPYIFPIGKTTLSFIAYHSWFSWRSAGSRAFMLCSQHC